MIARQAGWQEIRVRLWSKKVYTFEIPFANCMYRVYPTEPIPFLILEKTCTHIRIKYEERDNGVVFLLAGMA